MPLDTEHLSLIAEHANHIQETAVRDSFCLLVGLAAADPRFTCHARLQGAIRDFRWHSPNGDQPYALIVNRRSLLFYFRLPAVQSGRHDFADIKRRFKEAGINPSGEWTIPLETMADAKSLWALIEQGDAFESGEGESTRIGYVNRHAQRCEGHRGRSGNDHLQRAYRMRCLAPGCGHVYGANGSDIFQRKCPRCQGGASGIPF